MRSTGSKLLSQKRSAPPYSVCNTFEAGCGVHRYLITHLCVSAIYSSNMPSLPYYFHQHISRANLGFLSHCYLYAFSETFIESHSGSFALSAFHTLFISWDTKQLAQSCLCHANSLLHVIVYVERTISIALPLCDGCFCLSDDSAITALRLRSFCALPAEASPSFEARSVFRSSNGSLRQDSRAMNSFVFERNRVIMSDQADWAQTDSRRGRGVSAAFPPAEASASEAMYNYTKALLANVLQQACPGMATRRQQLLQRHPAASLSAKSQQTLRRAVLDFSQCASLRC